jgi:hypothetical protein
MLDWFMTTPSASLVPLRKFCSEREEQPSIARSQPERQFLIARGVQLSTCLPRPRMLKVCGARAYRSALVRFLRQV